MLSARKNQTVCVDKQLDSLLLGGGGSLLLGLLLESGLGLDSSVEGEGGVGDVTDSLDFASAGHVPDEASGDRSIYLELFHDDGAGEAENLRHLLADFVESLLLQEHIVVELILDLGLGPGLLLCLGSLSLLRLGALGG